MKITFNWLKEHLDTKFSEDQLLDKLTDIGLEVESVEKPSSDLEKFLVARILKTEPHPDADRLKVCDVDIGNQNILKVVCGAPNAREGLITIYAPPGAVIPKNKMKLVVAKIRGVTSHGMLCSESELNLSEDSEGITELDNKNYANKIGENYFSKSSANIIDISITPNRPDCLGVRGIARDLAAAGFGKLKELKSNKINSKDKQTVSIKIINEKNQGCSFFGSRLITNVKNTQSPDWLKEKIISIGQKPISAIVDITNYVMFDLNRPLHAYDADKIDKGIVVRNSKKGESFKALDNKDYKLDNDMCVISDNSGVLGLGGIIGGERSGTELDTKNVLIESAYFDSRSIRKTAKQLNIDTDAKFRFERGIDPQSIEQGLNRAAELITQICGFEISNKDILEILNNLGFIIEKKKNILSLAVPSWRPDINQEIDIIEELVRIYGYDKIETIEPKKVRNKPTLNKSQKLFHFLQRAVASKGYLEAITWSFSDSKVNELFCKNKNQSKIINPISADLNVLRNSIFSNLIIYLNKNINRGFKDVALFEIGPIFNGTKPGEQETVLTGLKAGKISRSSWLEKSRNVDVFDVKRDVIQTIVEAGYHKSKLYIDDLTPDYYHPGKSGRIFLNKGKENLAAYFGEIHPNIIKKIDIKTEALMGFEIFLDNLKETKKSLNDQKPKYETSDFQKSERDFAFIVDKNIEAQEILEVINNIDKELIKSSNIFDVYEGENIPNDKKSVAINLTIQSSDKTLNDDDLDRINKLVIETVEKKIGAKIRS